MKPMKRLSFLLLSCRRKLLSRSAGSKPFDAARLSPKGRADYQKLITAGVFRVGGVGFAGATSEEEVQSDASELPQWNVRIQE